MGDIFSYWLDPSAMNVFLFWLLVVIMVIGFIAILFIQSTRNPFQQQNDENSLEQLLKNTGYSYDPQQNIFYSRMDAWQRKYGYCRLYDEATAPLSMIIDCEPVHFEYGNKRWLIELWKGQYGMTTGCEIGVYTTDGPDLNIPNVFDGTFYHSVSEEDRLPMAFALRKDNRVLFRRRGTHWWLSGFILGEFSEPSDLILDAAITLKDSDMRKAFTARLLQMGYSSHEIGVVNNTVVLTFSTPHSAQPYSRTELISMVSQRKNKFLCLQYQNLTKGSHNMYEALNKIKQKSPELYSLVINMGKPAKLFRAYETLAKYLGKRDFG